MSTPAQNRKHLNQLRAGEAVARGARAQMPGMFKHQPSVPLRTPRTPPARAGKR